MNRTSKVLIQKFWFENFRICSFLRWNSATQLKRNGYEIRITNAFRIHSNGSEWIRRTASNGFDLFWTASNFFELLGSIPIYSKLLWISLQSLRTILNRFESFRTAPNYSARAPRSSGTWLVITLRPISIGSILSRWRYGYLPFLNWGKRLWQFGHIAADY